MATRRTCPGSPEAPMAAPATTRYDGDGHTREVRDGDLVAGNIIRFVNEDGSVPPFSDVIILRVEKDDVHVARPYAFCSQGSLLQGAEHFAIPKSYLRSPRYQIVLLASGKPYAMRT